MKVETMDLGRLRVGPPDWWGEVERGSYMSDEFWRAYYVLPPDLTVDFFSEPLGELRAELRGGLDRFRAECAPRVGLEVTCRGRVISSPVMVPVDERAYLVHKIADQLRGLVSAMGTIGAACNSAIGAIAQAVAALDQSMLELANDND